MLKLLRALTQAIALFCTLMLMTCITIWSAVEALAWIALL